MTAKNGTVQAWHSRTHFTCIHQALLLMRVMQHTAAAVCEWMPWNENVGPQPISCTTQAGVNVVVNGEAANQTPQA
jgi:hypothetical protein